MVSVRPQVTTASTDWVCNEGTPERRQGSWASTAATWGYTMATVGCTAATWDYTAAKSDYSAATWGYSEVKSDYSAAKWVSRTARWESTEGWWASSQGSSENSLETSSRTLATSANTWAMFLPGGKAMWSSPLRRMAIERRRRERLAHRHWASWDCNPETCPQRNQETCPG